MVEHDVHNLWLDMVKNRLVPFMVGKGFGDYVFTRVISNDSAEGFTYSLQVHIPDMGRYNDFMNEIISEYSAISVPAFGEKALYFSSLLKRIEL